MKLKDYYNSVVTLNENGGGWAGCYYGVFRDVVNGNNYKLTAEIGAGYGTHSKSVLDSCPSIERHIIIDPMKYYPNDGFATDIMSHESEVAGENFNELYTHINDYLSTHAKRYTWLRKNSQDVTEIDIPDESLDCIFVDGDHTFHAVLADVKLFWKKVRPGGQLLGDDIWMDGVRTAVDEFARIIGIPYDVLKKPGTQYEIYRFKKPSIDSSVISFTGEMGRLCNQVIRSFAISQIAKKHDLRVDYYNHTQIKRLGIPFYSGTKVHKSRVYLNDSNYWSILNSDTLQVNLDASQAFFQTNQIIQMLYSYLQSEPVRASVIQANPFRDRFQTNNDCCVHIRLTDAAKNNPGAQYYLDAIGKHSFDTLYICTDEQDHVIIKEIQARYPELKFVTYDEVETIQFASTCKYIVLSHGTYSAMMGYLAHVSSHITYPDFEEGKTWCGDIFSINGWEKQSLNK